MSTPELVVHRDESTLPAAIAARLIARLVEAQSQHAAPSVVLTGGGLGTAVLAAVAASPARDAVHWPALRVWWGDERYLPTGDPERNVTGARAALLDHVPVDPAHVHPMPALGDHPDAEDAAADYAAELTAAAGPLPTFDVCLLGIGPDGHVASLFPEQAALHADGTVVAVHGSPKPPPTRISLTLRVLRAADEVWILATGRAKADAVRLALSEGAGPLQVPAAGARGRSRTLFLLDEPAASALPDGFGRLASP
jgi:6-phosphogluconolactonase